MNSWHLKENYDNVHIIKDSYTRILSLCKLKNKALLTQVHAIFNPLHSFFFQIFNEVLQYLNVQETCKKDWHCFHKDCWFSNTVHRKLHRKILRILRVIPHCRSAVLPLSSASYLMVLSSYWHFLLVSGNLENLKKKCLNSLEEVTIEKNKYYWIKATYE